MTSISSVSTWLLTVALSSCSPAREPEPVWRFLLDGEACSPVIASLEGTPDRPGPDDVVRLAGFSFRLGEPRTRRLRRVKDGERTSMLIDEESGAIVACDAAVFPAIGPVKRSKLVGLRLEEWNEEVERSLVDLDLERVVITVTEGTMTGELGIFPPLPEALRALCVECNSYPTFHDWKPLRGLRELRFLRLDGWARPSRGFDLFTLREARQLRHLDFGTAGVAGAEVLTAFPALRQLEAGWEGELGNLSFVDALPELRILRLPLLDLERFAMEKPARNLVTLDLAFNAELTDFPAELFPNLESLDLGGTGVPAAAVKAYRRSHPRCRIVFAPEQETLGSVLARCDRLRVREGGTSRLDGSEKVLIEETDPAELKHVLSWLCIAEDYRLWTCGCSGEPTFELYEGNDLIATLGLHHGRSIRWGDGTWTGDAELAEEVREPLARWLAERGVGGPLEELLD